MEKDRSFSGFRFTNSKTSKKDAASFETLLSLFLELTTHTSGDVTEALDWMNQLDREYKITSSEYGMGDFIEDLKKNGYIKTNDEEGNFSLTSKSEIEIRKSALEQVFGKLRKGLKGNHNTSYTGAGDESIGELKAFEFGDSLDKISITDSLQNGMLRLTDDNRFQLEENDLLVTKTEHKTQVSTVLMIDISHSMILYGEDRITPAKKVAMALSELILTKYPKDHLDIIVFGNDAWQIQIKDLPYLEVGPYYTNTVAGLELAMDLLRKRKYTNKQIFMITDGKPTCLKIGGQYYQNSFGLDRKVINKTLQLAAQCKRIKIPVTTFMIAKDPYLVQFVEEFTEVNNGRAFYSGLNGLGEFVFKDYENNRVKYGR